VYTTAQHDDQRKTTAFVRREIAAGSGAAAMLVVLLHFSSDICLYTSATWIGSHLFASKWHQDSSVLWRRRRFARGGRLFHGRLLVRRERERYVYCNIYRVL
jgi:hypothetical protein